MTAAPTIVWDLGAVLLRWEPDTLVRTTLAHHLEDDDHHQRLAGQIFQDFVPGSDWSAFDRGEVSEADLADRIAVRTGLPSADIRSMIDQVGEHLEVQWHVVELVAQTRQAGHAAVYLSNMPAPFAAALEASDWFTDAFTDGVFSCRVRAAKPEPEIFAAAERLLGVGPGTALLVDDRAPNVAAARARGWFGVQFTDVEQCRTDLAAFGMLTHRG